MPAGDYLTGARPEAATQSFADLSADLVRVIERVVAT